jgi:DUF2075 family protein
MIVYKSTKEKFLNDILSNRIEDIILETYRQKRGAGVGNSEIQSWKNSLSYMGSVLSTSKVPNEAGIAIEFIIPMSSNRIDFIVSGFNGRQDRTVVIIELKQWEKVECTDMDAQVRTYFRGGLQQTNHPSYQAWSYSALLSDFNAAITKFEIKLVPCAYLHNCISKSEVHNEFYKRYSVLAPSFLKSDAVQFQRFIEGHINQGDHGDSIVKIDQGELRPTKQLADVLSSMLVGNAEFTLIDEQKVVFETARKVIRNSRKEQKHVIIVEGGPGTGKSVVAVNLLVDAIAGGHITKYVSKNAAPRAVYESMLTGTFTKSRISNLFSGSGQFHETAENVYDALIVDEAHRLNEKSGLYGNLGENQIREIIGSSRSTVFFIDEDQRVTLKDIGKKISIQEIAQEMGAKVTNLELVSQFRCNGSDGYIAWLDNLLEIRETANFDLRGLDYEVIVCESPIELRDRIINLNMSRNKSRMVAGYCWDWLSKKDPNAMDIVIPEYEFRAKWNLAEDGSLWILKPSSISEVGCIHTCQGLELEYVGVIFGEDIVRRGDEWVIQPEKRSSQDKSIRGYKRMLKDDRAGTMNELQLIIKNTYRTLMTRGQKGCLLFSVDEETNEYFKGAVSNFK